jgi:hypothetical protein
MVQMIKRAAAQVQNAFAGKVRVFIDENGNIATKDQTGKIKIIGDAKIKTGIITPRRAEITPGGEAIIFINTFTGTTTTHFEKWSKWKSSNDKEDKMTRNAAQFVVGDLLNLTTPFIKAYISEANTSTSVINNILNYASTAANHIYTQTNIPDQNYFISADNSNSRHIHELCIDVLLNYAKHFDPTTKIKNEIPKQNLVYFNFDPNITTSQTEIDLPDRFQSENIGEIAEFQLPEQKAYLGKIIAAFADLLNQLYDTSDFLNTIPTTDAIAANRDPNYIITTFNTLLIEKKRKP